jgi:HK97 family phage portal protein
MMPRELYVLRPDRVQIIPGKNFLPKAFRYCIGKSKLDYNVDAINGIAKILHIKNFHPTSDWYGLSPIEAAAYSIDQHNSAAAWNQSLLQNGARPSGAIVVKDDKYICEEQFDRLKEQVKENFSGYENAGKPIILEGGLAWQDISLSPKDMDLYNVKIVRQEILP